MLTANGDGVEVEDGDETRQRIKHARQREAFKRRAEHEADPEPEMPQVDNMRDPWSVHSDGCPCRACVQRFGRVIGKHPEGCRCARCYSKLKEEATQKNPNRRVVPLQLRKRPEREDLTKPHSAAVVELRPEPRPATVAGLLEGSDDWLNHPLSCECSDCAAGIPTCARPVERKT